MRLEEFDDGYEKSRIACAAAELVRPDSGQIEKALRPALVPERCRKSGKGYGNSVDWSRRRHGLDTNHKVKEANWRRF